MSLSNRPKNTLMAEGFRFTTANYLTKGKGQKIGELKHIKLSVSYFLIKK